MPEPKFAVWIYRLLEAADEPEEYLVQKGYHEVPCARAGYQLFLGERTWPPKWQPFLNGVSAQVLGATNRENSFVLLRTTPHSTYAVTGGLGNWAIRPLIDQDFGLDIATRLISPDKVKAIRQKGFTGSVEQQETVYRGRHTLSGDPLNWIRATRAVLGLLESRTVAERLGIESEGRRTIRLEGRSGFSLRKQITIDQFEAIIGHLDSILEDEPLIPIMKGCSEAAKEHRLELDSVLGEALARQYQMYLEDLKSPLSTDLSFSYEDSRLLASSASFILKAGRREGETETLDIESVFSQLRQWGWESLVPSAFLRLRITGRDDDGRITFEDDASNLLAAELMHEQQTYFRADGRWFHAEASFIETLNQRLADQLAQDRGFTLPMWPVDGGKVVHEDLYLEETLFSAPEYRILHRRHILITGGGDKAELCDVLDRRRGAPAFVFVKRGVGASVRELARQACDSTVLFLYDPGFRDRAQDKVRELGDPLDLSAVRAENLEVVLAVVDNVLRRRDEPLLHRLSTLAKMELASALEELRGRGLQAVWAYEISSAR